MVPPTSREDEGATLETESETITSDELVAEDCSLLEGMPTPFRATLKVKLEALAATMSVLLFKAEKLGVKQTREDDVTLIAVTRSGTAFEILTTPPSNTHSIKLDEENPRPVIVT